MSRKMSYIESKEFNIDRLKNARGCKITIPIQRLQVFVSFALDNLYNYFTYTGINTKKIVRYIDFVVKSVGYDEQNPTFYDINKTFSNSLVYLKYLEDCIDYLIIFYEKGITVNPIQKLHNIKSHIEKVIEKLESPIELETLCGVQGEDPMFSMVFDDSSLRIKRW